MKKIIETKRLTLRTWGKRDAKAYFNINQSPKVLEFLSNSMTIEQVYIFIENCNEDFKKKNFCLFAVEIRETKEMIGFIGLSEPKWEAHFTPCVEIAWRISSDHWNKGYATEGALSVLEYGFDSIGLTEVVSFTTAQNKRSIRVMEKIGMQYDINGDFAHPKLSPTHPLSKHILYRIKR